MTKPVRVLYVVSDLLEGQGGIQSFVMSVFEHIDRSRVQIDFVLFVDGEPSFVPTIQSLGGKVYRASQFKKEGPLAYIRWWIKFFKEHPEYKIVHGHMKAYISLYLLIAKLYGRTTIAHSHIAFPHLPLLKKYAEKLALFPLRWIADYHFACSVQAGEYMFGKNIVKKPSFHFIPNARNTQSFVYNESIRKTMRQKMGLTDSLIIGNVGRLDEQKNHKFLVKIFEEIYKRNSKARLLLLGTGRLKHEIKQQVEAYGLTKFVLFMDIVANPQDYYQIMDVFVFPSFYEGLGMVLTEAQISGLPCVFSDNLPQEIEIVPELCHRVSLKETQYKWADIIMAQFGIRRVSHDKEAAEKSFEITSLVKSLKDFYLGHAGK